MLTLGFSVINRFFLPFFLLFFVIEVVLTTQCFKDKKSDVIMRLKAFIYCLLEEIIKGFYLPYYLLIKSDFNFTMLVRIFYQFLKWEEEKYRQTKLEYAKIWFY